MLKFYMDESGIHKSPEGAVCAVAGFAASDSAWKAFIPKWAQLLRRERFANHRLVTGGRTGEGCDSSQVTNLPLVRQPIG